MEELLANIIKEADHSKLPALKISAQDALGKKGKIISNIVIFAHF